MKTVYVIKVRSFFQFPKLIPSGQQDQPKHIKYVTSQFTIPLLIHNM